MVFDKVDLTEDGKELATMDEKSLKPQDEKSLKPQKELSVMDEKSTKRKPKSSAKSLTKGKKKFYLKPVVIIPAAILVVAGVALLLLLPGSAPAAATVQNTVAVEKRTLRNEVLVSGTVISKDVSKVYAPSSLEVLEVLKDVGDTVKEGEQLVVLDTEQLELDIRQAELNIKSSQSSLTTEELSNSNSRKSASNSVESAKLSLEQAQRDYDKAVSENGGSAVRNAQLALEEAQRSYNNAANPSTSIYTAQLDLDSAQDKYDQAVKDKNDAYSKWQTEVASPTDAKEPAASEATYKTKSDAADSAYIALQKAQVSYYNTVKSINDGVETARASLEKAQMAYDDAVKNASEGIQSAKDKLQNAQISYRNASDSLNAAKSKDTTGSVTSLEIQEMNLEQKQKQLKDAEVLSPTSGTITYSGITLGAAVSGLMFVIEDVENLAITTTVDEYNINQVQVGQAAIIRFDSASDTDFEGKVTRISPAAAKDASGDTTASTSVQFDVEVSVTTYDPRIKIGMNAQVSIITEEKKDVLAVPFDALIDRGERSIIRVQQGEDVQTIMVQKGMETDAYIEIISDEVYEGMLVLTTSEGGASLPSGQSNGMMFNMGGGGGGNRPSGGAPPGGG